MATSKSFANHLAPGFRDWVGTTFKSAPVIYSRIFNVETTRRAYEDYAHAATIPKAVTKKEAEPIQFVDPLEGSTVRITPSAKAMGVTVSRELWTDVLYKAKSAVHRSARALAMSYIHAVETDAADVFNSGFTSYGTIDGASSLFNTAHPRLDGGGNQANRPTTDAGLSLTTMRAGMVQFRKWVDDRGNKIDGNPRVLLVPIDLEYRAQELLRTSGKPGTNLNDVNVTQGALQIITWRYLTSPTAWYILGSPNWLLFLWRERPMLDSYDDRDKKVAKFTVWGRHGVGAVHWHNVYGTTGA